MSAVQEAVAPFATSEAKETVYPRPYRLTADQYEPLIDSGLLAGVRVQLIGGELKEMPPNHVPHTLTQSELLFRLRDEVVAAKLPLEVLTAGSVRTGLRDVPEPDIFVWRSVPRGKSFPGASVLLTIEVCRSTHAMDLGRKPAIYKCWVVDLRARSATLMWSPGAEVYAGARTVPFGADLRAATLPITTSTEGLG